MFTTASGPAVTNPLKDFTGPENVVVAIVLSS
jgi:hypothetical protein